MVHPHQTRSAQYWLYAEEAMLSARQSKSELEKQGLMDLARTWTQAAMQSETAPLECAPIDTRSLPR